MIRAALADGRRRRPRGRATSRPTAPAPRSATRSRSRRWRPRSAGTRRDAARCVDRLGQDQHRPPRGGRRHRRPDQGGAGAAARRDPRPSALHERRTRTSTGTTLPARVPTRLDAVAAGRRPRIAGVSSFGFTGTNAHAILEEAPPVEAGPPALERPFHILTVSARTDGSLREPAARIETRLSDDDAGPVADVCFTANAGRSHFAHRLAITGQSTRRDPPGADGLDGGPCSARSFRTRGRGIAARCRVSVHGPGSPGPPAWAGG